MPENVEADLSAQPAAVHHCQTRVREGGQRYDLDTLRRHFDDLLDYAERLARAEITRSARAFAE